MSDNLINSAQVSIPGGWLVLSTAPYSIADNTLSEITSRVRAIQAQSDLIAGEYTVAVVEGNETFPLNIRVRGNGSQGSCFTAARALKRALQQRTYVLETTLGDWTMSWSCFAADVSIASEKALLYASQAVVSATVSALPQEA